MTDLRTGLVEAMADELREHWGFNLDDAAALAWDLLDVALGFLSTNAEAWRAMLYDHDWIDGETGSISGMLREFIGLLQDTDQQSSKET